MHAIRLEPRVKARRRRVRQVLVETGMSRVNQASRTAGVLSLMAPATAVGCVPGCSRMSIERLKASSAYAI
jgi:hypothetical protein